MKTVIRYTAIALAISAATSAQAEIPSELLNKANIAGYDQLNDVKAHLDRTDGLAWAAHNAIGANTFNDQRRAEQQAERDATQDAAIGDVKAHADRNTGLAEANQRAINKQQEYNAENDARNQRQDASIDNAHARIGGVQEQADADRAASIARDQQIVADQQFVDAKQTSDLKGYADKKATSAYRTSVAHTDAKVARADADRLKGDQALQDRIDGNVAAQGQRDAGQDVAIADTNGRVDRVEQRTDVLESRDAVHDARLDAGEAHDVLQDERGAVRDQRLDAGEQHDVLQDQRGATRDQRLDATEAQTASNTTRNDQQDVRIDQTADTANTALNQTINNSNRISANTEYGQETRNITTNNSNRIDTVADQANTNTNDIAVERGRNDQQDQSLYDLVEVTNDQQDQINTNTETNGRQTQAINQVNYDLADFQQRVNADMGAVSSQVNNNTAAINSMQDDISDLRGKDKDLEAGIAGAYAAASHQFLPSGGFQMSVAGGAYEGQTATSLAIGGPLSDRTFLNGNVTHDSRGNFGYGVGLNIQFK